jgi:hypothetical protein
MIWSLCRREKIKLKRIWMNYRDRLRTSGLEIHSFVFSFNFIFVGCSLLRYLCVHFPNIYPQSQLIISISFILSVLFQVCFSFFDVLILFVYFSHSVVYLIHSYIHKLLWYPSRVIMPGDWLPIFDTRQGKQYFCFSRAQSESVLLYSVRKG